MRHVLVISFSNLETDPRVNRQIRWLREEFRVTAAGYADPKLADVDFIPLRRETKSPIGRGISAGLLLGRQYERFYWEVAGAKRHLEALSGIRPDLVVANDIESLPLALRVAQGRKVIFDAHEYAPRQYEDKLSFRIFHQRYQTYLCQKYIPRAAAMLTVSAGISEQYERDTGIRPTLITNAPDLEELCPGPVSRDRIRLVHHGAAIESRWIESMIEMMDHVDPRFELTLMLTEASKPYLQRLQRLAAKRANVFFRPPVPMRELPRYLNQFDVGVYLLRPLNFNSRYSLPNKLFEFVQARLAVAIGPSPEMAAVVNQYGLGAVSETFSPGSLAAELNRITAEQIVAFKQRAHSAARELSAERNSACFLSLVESVVHH